MHDIVVVGAGPVGATFALGLADCDLDVVALDARAPGETPRGDRALALSHGSRLILERVGVWRTLPAQAATAITAIAGASWLSANRTDSTTITSRNRLAACWSMR